jgi:DNA repair protein RAD7
MTVLTSYVYLQSQNISANQIRADAAARRAAADAAAAATAQGDSSITATSTTAQEVDDNDDENEEGPTTATGSAASRAQTLKRKKQAAAIEKIKKSKAFKKRKKDADASDSDDLANAIFGEKMAPLPGQMENCEICDKRFTVTPYSRTGPSGGLICGPCGKDLAKDGDPAKKKKKKAGPPAGGIGGRRKIQSRILDGESSVGAKSLMSLCVETLRKNIHLADDFGELPPMIIDKVARTLSKHRLVNSQNLDLFLNPETDEVKIYDGSRLTSLDYMRVFQMVPRLKSFKARNAIQFKDEVLQYLAGRNINLDTISLHGANLLSEDSWRAYLEVKGNHIKCLQVYFTDRHFGDDLIASLKDLCPSLNRLKIVHNQKVTDKGVEHIAKLIGLEHLSLDLREFTTTEPYVKAINGVGSSLHTLSLREVRDLDDRVLDAIHDNCRSLEKLRITQSEEMTDAGFARLFKNWANRPLTFIDLQKCRYVDSANPRENPHKVGLCGDGFRALMQHSGKVVKKLNVHACRNISKEAFEDVFSEAKRYPALNWLEVSFCEEVDDYIVGCIFRSCPNLKELNVFGCMKVKDAKVPRGKILVGVPNAMGMMVEGLED